MPMVLLHPIGLNPECWDGLGFGDAITPTYPGHGTAPRAKARYSLEMVADTVAASVEGQLDLIGISMGGMVAEHVALRHPDRVRSMVLACTAASCDPELMEARARQAHEHGMQSVLDETLTRWFSAEALRKKPRPPAVTYASEALMAIHREAFADAWRAMAKHSVTDRLSLMNVPVTCIAGADDRASSLTTMEELAARLPQSRLVILPGPHMLHLECPRQFRDAVDEHMKWVSSLKRPEGMHLPRRGIRDRPENVDG